MTGNALLLILPVLLMASTLIAGQTRQVSSPPASRNRRFGPTDTSGGFGLPPGDRSILARPPRRSSPSLEWLSVADLFTRRAAAVSSGNVRRAGIEPGVLGSTSLYGSATRDARGGHYVAGITPLPARHALDPILLRVEP